MRDFMLHKRLTGDDANYVKTSFIIQQSSHFGQFIEIILLYKYIFLYVNYNNYNIIDETQ